MLLCIILFRFGNSSIWNSITPFILFFMSKFMKYLAMEGLDDRSKDILASRWLSDDKATLHDLADKYGISAERVRQLEKNAMNKIKAKMVA